MLVRQRSQGDGGVPVVQCSPAVTMYIMTSPYGTAMESEYSMCRPQKKKESESEREREEEKEKEKWEAS